LALVTVSDSTGLQGLVRISLYAGPTGNENAFVTADHSAPTRYAQFYSDDTGAWTHQLTSNADITPAGTVYLVDEYYATNKYIRKVISVPPGGPYDADALLTTLPSGLGGGSGGPEVDPVATPLITAHAADQGNPHVVTKAQVGLGAVDNVADVDKPVSTLQAAAIASAVANLINGAPGALDTLNELATALGDDASFAATVTSALAGKQPLDSDLTSIAALATTAFGRALLTLADAPALRTTAGLGDVATHSASEFALAGSGGSTVISELLVKVDPDTVYTANAPAKTPVTTPDASGQIVEPAVCYIPEGWNGHKYWFAITGYTNGDNATENPSVYYSDDGVTLTPVPGVAFPLVPQPSGGNNADPELVHGPDNRLYLIFHENVGTTKSVKALSTADGTTWTSPITLFSSDQSVENAVGAITFWDDAHSQWVLFYTDWVTGSTPTLKRRTAPTLTAGAFSAATVCTVNGLPSGKSLFEAHLGRRGRQLHMVSTLKVSDASAGAADIWFAVSDDNGLTWTLGSSAILTTSAGWDNTYIYRGDIVPLDNAIDGLYELWYSAADSSGHWWLGHTTIKVGPKVLKLTANSATPAINTDAYKTVHITGQSAAITSFTTNLTGTPRDGDTLRVSITDSGTAVAITWGGKFASSTTTLPTTTVAGQRLDVGFFWNTETSKWRCVAAA
jgi:hypothetical protein